jgi:hypothetical protein
VRALLVTRLSDVDAQMQELKAFRRTLKTALENCDAALGHGTDLVECPVVRSLGVTRGRGKRTRS